MASALAGYVLPSSGQVLDIRVDVAGTLFGAVCFLLGAVLMVPAWKKAVRQARTVRPVDPVPESHDRH
jgi:hypothetical protein